MYMWSLTNLRSSASVDKLNWMLVLELKQDGAQEAVRMQFRMVAAQGHRRGSGSTLRTVTGCAPVLLTGG